MQAGPPPFYYAGPTTPHYPREGRVAPWIFAGGAVVVVALFMLLRTQSPRPPASIPVSQFMQDVRDGRVASVRIDADTLHGRYVAPMTGPGGVPVGRFRTHLPPGTTADFQFLDWLNRAGKGSATIEVGEERQNLLLSVLIPLVPWILIFGFVWFLVRRARPAQPGIQLVLSGPGRWVPDPPAVTPAMPGAVVPGQEPGARP